jgi:RNA polymerase sigma factor (TIGR02999 family)
MRRPGCPDLPALLALRPSRPGRDECGIQIEPLLSGCHARTVPADLTQMLHAVEAGDPRAAADLLPAVYAELRRLAASRMAHEPRGHTLQPTALVHEAWLRLGGDEQPHWETRAHFFAAAAEAMRRILVERARRRLAAKRGGGCELLDVDALELPAPVADDEGLLRVNEALERLALLDPRKAELVKLRYFVGLNFEETAAALGIAVPTAKQWWAYARAWLSVELTGHAKIS